MLPISPSKQKSVNLKLTVEINCKIVESSIEYRAPTILNEEIKQKLFEFYENDDISRMSPGIKDRVAIRINGSKNHIQKRHIYMSLKEIHALFIAENENIKISRSKFASLRPLHVLLSRQTPANLCTCIYHQILILALKKLSVYSANIPVYSNKFADSCLQCPDDPTCWFSKCQHEECGFKKKRYQLQCDSDILENIVEWKQLLT